MGLIGQPFYITEITAILLGETSNVYYSVIRLCQDILRVLGKASVFHVALMNVECYIAIKHSFAHITMITKARLLSSSAFLWIGSLLLTVPLATIDNNMYLTVSNISLAICVAVTIFCQVTLYFETRRHEKQIAIQQVSVEGRQILLKEKKAFKVKTTVLFFLLFTYLPLIFVRILTANSVIDSFNLRYIAFFMASSIIMLGSLINPIIYCVRYFRVVFVELLLRKSNEKAEEIEINTFRKLNAVVPFECIEERPQTEEGQTIEHNISYDSGL